MLRYSSMCILAGLALVVSACGGGNEQDDAGVQQDASTPQFDRDVHDQAVQDDAAVGDNNDSFEQAVQMDFTSANQKSGVVNPAGDLDFFKFNGTEGQWIALWISANEQCTDGQLDPVVTLYDSTQTQIAENDDELPGYNCDSWLVTRLPATGLYYAKVQDWTSRFETDPADYLGKPTYTYKIYIFELQHGTADTHIDQEPGNDIGTAGVLTIPEGNAGALLGTYASASDVDVFTFTLAVNATPRFTFAAEGAEGSGSTAKLGQVSITDPTGTTVVARIDGAEGMLKLSPPLLAAGSYAVFVRPAAGAIGGNPFYAASFYTSTTDNPPDLEGATATGANDTKDTAEALTESSTAGSYYVLSHLPTEGDVDYYKFDVAAGTTLSAACGALRSGSGVLGLTVSVRDGSDAELRAGTEAAGADLVVGGSASPINITTAGTYYVRLSKTAQSTDVAATWIRCGIHSRAQP